MILLLRVSGLLSILNDVIPALVLFSLIGIDLLLSAIRFHSITFEKRGHSTFLLL